MICIEEFPENPSQLIGPPGTRVLVRMKESHSPMVAPVNYSPSNPFVIGDFTGTDPQSLTKSMSRLIINPVPQSITKPVLVLGGGETEQVLEIGGITRTGRVYQPKEMNQAEEKKRKGKEVLAEEPQRKKRVS